MTNHTYAAHYVAAKIKPKPIEKITDTGPLWILVAAILLLMASCTKRVEQPIQLRTPVRPALPITVTIQATISTTVYGYPTWSLMAVSDRKVTSDVTIFYEFYETGKTHTLGHVIYKDSDATHAHTQARPLSLSSKITGVKLLRVEGDSVNIYKLVLL